MPPWPRAASDFGFYFTFVLLKLIRGPGRASSTSTPKQMRALLGRSYAVFVCVRE